MAKTKKQYDDDDGRTIADMSGVERQPLVVPHFSKKEGNKEPVNSENTDDFQLTDSERRAFIGGALGAAVAIASVFVAVGGIVIFLLTRIH